MALALVRSLARKFVCHITNLYWSDIRVKDAHLVPERKPVVFLVNHSAGLCDVLMMLSQCPRVVHFWAASFWWESPIIASICTALNFIPVTRAQERDRKKPLYQWPLKSRDPEATFEYSLQLLKNMQCVALCPEGETHTQSHMAHFRTGTARMLYEAAQQGMDGLLVQGCGLMYLDRGHARTPVVVEFGTPISVKTILERSGITPSTGGLPAITEELLQKITDVLQIEMKDVTINADDWPSVRALRTAAELYQPDHARLPLEMEMEIVQRFANKYADLKDKPDVGRAIEASKAYNDELDTLNVHDYHIKSQVTEFNQFVMNVVHLCWTICWYIPGAIIGIPLHAPVYFLVSRAWKAIVSKPDADRRRLEGKEVRQTFPHFLPGALDLADTMKIGIGVLLYIIGYILTTLIVAFWRGGWYALAWLIVSPWLHAVSMRHLSEVIHGWTKLRTRLRLYLNRTRVITLQQKRLQLQVVARTMVDQFADPELTRIFPKSSF